MAVIVRAGGPSEEAGRPPGKVRQFGRPPAGHAARDEKVQPGKFKPRLRDHDVDAIERELTDDDFGSPAQRARAENAMRRLVDHALVEELRAAGFAGPVFEVAQTELAAYGISVLMGWMRTGQIFAQCKANGRPLSTSTPQCLLQMRNVFDGWLTEQRRWAQVVDETPLDDAIGGDPQWADPTGNAVVRACTIQEWLDSITDPKTRHAARLVLAYQASHQEAGQAVGLSAGAVEGRLYRLRRSS